MFHAVNSPCNRAELLKGPIQVVPRAELRAMIHVAQTLTEPTTALCDCAFVVDGAAKLVKGHSIGHLQHQDLWREFKRLLDGHPP